jgi:hypothetical protein
MPHRVHIFNNIRAIQDTARRRTELFYGASSPFSVLQHLDAHLPTEGSPAAYPGSNVEEYQDGSESIRSYNYQSIVFDHLPNSHHQPDGLVSSSYASAKIALRNFLAAACPRLPFLDPSKLCANFETVYSSSDGGASATTDRILVIAALGLGALPIVDLPCRQLFLAQARAEIVSTMYDIDLKTVQATVLMAQFEFEAGSPSICYLHLGSAIRKAFAAGVHRVNTREAKQTMWALYCNESLLCFKFGRQFGLQESDIAVPKSEDASYMSYYVRLCSIVRSAYRIYHLDDTVVADLTCAKSVHQQLCGFSAMLKANTGLEIGGQLYTLAGEDLAWHITISYGKSQCEQRSLYIANAISVYHVTRLLVYRPFLLLCLELKRRGVNDIAGIRNGGVAISELNEAAELCVSSARDIVELCDSLFSLQIGAEVRTPKYQLHIRRGLLEQGIYNHAFYLESACFVLGLAAVHDGNRDAANCLLERANTGLRLLQQLGKREPAQSIGAAVEQMIARIRALLIRTGPIVTQAVGNNQLPTVTADLSRSCEHPESSLSNISTLDPIPGRFAPNGWENGVLDDLWSMMDWDVGFP